MPTRQQRILGFRLAANRAARNGNSNLATCYSTAANNLMRRGR